MNTDKYWTDERLQAGKRILDALLSSPKLPFDETIRAKLSEEHGIYAIYIKSAAPGEILRAGRTKTAIGGLRQRVYQNHLMGNQSGNLRAQLVRDGVCSDSEQAKAWIRQNCLVQFVVVKDDELRRWAEHFVLSIFRPKYSD
jgi:hypothetical protein